MEKMVKTTYLVWNVDGDEEYKIIKKMENAPKISLIDGIRGELNLEYMMRKNVDG